MDRWYILGTMRHEISFVGCLPLWFITVVTSSPENLHSHRQCRSPYRGMSTLASHTSYTSLFLCILLCFICHFNNSALYKIFHTSQLHNLGYIKRQLQGRTSDVCGQYCCFFRPLHGQGYTPQQFTSLFAGRGNNADLHVEQMFATGFGGTLLRGGWGQCCHSCI